jgi:hypothetical protein
VRALTCSLCGKEDGTIVYCGVYSRPACLKCAPEAYEREMESPTPPEEAKPVESPSADMPWVYRLFGGFGA